LQLQLDKLQEECKKLNETHAADRKSWDEQITELRTQLEKSQEEFKKISDAHCTDRDSWGESIQEVKKQLENKVWHYYLTQFIS
jgi:hypothetical protein